MADTVTISLETDDAEDALEVPTALIDLLAEGDESVPAVVGDIAMLGIAQQAHGAVHHSQADADDEVAAAESLAMDLFEERFGRSFAEMTGHDH